MEDKLESLKELLEELQQELTKRLEKWTDAVNYPNLTDLCIQYNAILKKVKIQIDMTDFEEFTEPVDENPNDHYQLRMGIGTLLRFIKVEKLEIENKKLRNENRLLKNKLRRYMNTENL